MYLLILYPFALYNLIKLLHFLKKKEQPVFRTLTNSSNQISIVLYIICIFFIVHDMIPSIFKLDDSPSSFNIILLIINIVGIFILLFTVIIGWKKNMNKIGIYNSGILEGLVFIPWSKIEKYSYSPLENNYLTFHYTLRNKTIKKKHLLEKNYEMVNQFFQEKKEI